MKVMNETDLLPRLQAAITTILEISGNDISRCSETESSFSLRIPVQVASLAKIVAKLCGYSDLLDSALRYQIQQGSGTAQISPEGLVSVAWEEDVSLSPPALDADTFALYDALVNQLSTSHNCLRPEDLERDLSHLVLLRHFI